jgi:hypothetical protein
MRTATRVVTSRRTTIDDLLPKFLVYFDASRNITMATSTNISQWVDRVSGLVASQATSSAQPLINNTAGNLYVNMSSSSRFLTINIPTPLNINTSQVYFCSSNAVFSCIVNIPNNVTSLDIGRPVAGSFLLNSIIIFNGVSTPEEDLRIIEFLKTKLAYNSQTLGGVFDGSSIISIGRRVTSISSAFFAGITNLTYSWCGCTLLTSFPLLNTSNVVNFLGAWQSCSGLTSFSLLNTSSGTNFEVAWDGCAGLTSFPLLDFAKGTNFRSSWRGCTSLTSFPLLNTSNGTYFTQAWRICSNLTNFPANFFDNWVGNPIADCFLNTWETCPKLTAQSVENILVSLAFSGKSAPAGATGTQADITITYATNTGSLSTATTNAITTLKSRGWKPTINGTYV